MGPAGDLPNDYKFLFGGAVVRDIVGNRAWYGGYSSLWVELPVGYPTGSEVNSPFDPDAPPIFDHDFGNDAQALFEEGGQDLLGPAQTPGNQVRAFYEPRGIRAGSLLHVGDRASFGGYIVPLGPQTLDLTITKPSGAEIRLSDTANAWGHAYDDTLLVTVDEPGTWTVDVSVTACPPPTDAFPCTSGGLNDGTTQYVFYVASAGTAPMTLVGPSVLPPNQAFETAETDIDGGGHYTAWMPGWTLESDDLTPGHPILEYEWPEYTLPNFELHDAHGLPVDQVALTGIVEIDGIWHGAALDVWGPHIMRP